RGHAFPFIKNYLSYRFDLTVWNIEEYHQKLRNYYTSEIADYTFTREVLGVSRSHIALVEMKDLYSYTMSQVKSVELLAEVEEAFMTAQRNTKEMLERNASLFYTAKDSSGKTLDSSY